MMVWQPCIYALKTTFKWCFVCYVNLCLKITTKNHKHTTKQLAKETREEQLVKDMEDTLKKVFQRGGSDEFYQKLLKEHLR